MKVKNFYPLISRNARVTLVGCRSKKVIYSGSVRDIPDNLDETEVVDFSMNDQGHLTFKIR